MTATALPLDRSAIDAKLVALVSAGAVGLGVLLSGFVVFEPAPYELYMVALIAVWALFGLRISRTVAPLLVLLVVFNLGGVLSVLQMADIKDTPLYIAVSLFLAFTAVFFAAVVERQPSLYPLIFKAWIVAATLTSVLGVAGYFHAFPGAELFTKYDRAAGAFQDPNVFGPYLTLPALWLMARIMTGRIIDMPRLVLPLLFIVFAIFLSFSRGAWGLFAFSAILTIFMLLVQNPNPAFRMRILVMAMIAIALIAVALVIALQFPQISDLFFTRAKLEQDYDSARLGRFARHAIGFLLAMERPFGIGPLEFGLTYGEDTHNMWLKALMDYGWLGFASWVLMIVWTLAGGLRSILRRTPWQPYVTCAWATVAGHVMLGNVIDTDHWRHLYLLIGLVWAGMALDYRDRLAALRRNRAGDAIVLAPTPQRG